MPAVQQKKMRCRCCPQPSQSQGHGHPHASSVGDLRLITCESGFPNGSLYNSDDVDDSMVRNGCSSRGSIAVHRGALVLLGSCSLGDLEPMGHRMYWLMDPLDNIDYTVCTCGLVL